MGSLTEPSILTEKLLLELRNSIRGQVYQKGESNFAEYTLMFNGNVETNGQVVTCPMDAEDVSKIILFCRKHAFSPSVKAGGFGTAGWAVGGEVIIDLSRIGDVDVEPPNEKSSYTSIRDMAPSNSKGKKPEITPSDVNSGKRRREEDDKLRKYHAASGSVAAFLQEPSRSDSPPPNVRRRLNKSTEGSHDNISDTNIRVVQSPTLDSNVEAPDVSLGDDARNARSAHANDNTDSSNAPFDADPFGYLEERNSSGYPGRSNLQSTSRMRQKEIDTFTANNPLRAQLISGGQDTVPYHVPFAAHPAGSSIMLLGGFGFLGRLYGLSIDNLVEVEMVLADGRIVIVNKDEHPDLWWALRGAGPAFGVATRYKAKAYPIPVVFAGNLIYRFHKATAASLIKHFRDCIKNAPRELYANVLLTAGPKGKDSLIVIQMCYVGSREKGQEYLAALASWDGEKSLLNEVNEKSFLHQQDSVAQVLRGKAGRQWFIRSALINSLPDDIIHQTVLKFDDTPVGCTWLFELAGGAIIAALHQWDMGINDPRCITTAEDWIAETLKPIQTGGPFPSFLGRHEAPSRTISAFGSNWDRLKELKKIYDPTNVFRNSLWPLDSEGNIVEASTHEPATPSAAGFEFLPGSWIILSEQMRYGAGVYTREK
ncbi:fad fmn-containing dehydrogenase [Lentinula edodes]|uniref:Fad fmn-containing dehydrogenase n=1 Tax=Lentinula edodes TaxID=5353 RepID=A0A1Q3DWC0_LENED|nr:fad fmn-containing dehydrogenase [Lentinula edodes]